VIDHKLAGPLYQFPDDSDDQYALVEMPTEGLIRTICERVVKAADGATDITAVGVALPGLIKNGVVDDAPNLPQLKGSRVQELLTAQLHNHGLKVWVDVLNDADAVASGLAASIGKLDHTIRVWTMGIGIGYGRYPFSQSAGEGGHTVVTLDDKERFCGCGGRGHIEGIMGHRAMRLRFLDMEPEEVFEAANAGDPKCLEFKRLWHKALAAGTASSIHMDGPGKFFLTGLNLRFVDLPMLKDYVQEMVKMSPLQSYTLEIVTDVAETRVIGAAVAAEQASTR
jgi:glucokinase